MLLLSLELLRVVSAGDPPFPNMVQPSPTHAEGVWNSRDGCSTLVMEWYKINHRQCVNRRGTGTQRQVNVQDSWAVPCPEHEKYCDARFKCTMLGDYYACPASFIQMYFNGVYTMKCNPKAPHLFTTGQGELAMALCMDDKELVSASGFNVVMNKKKSETNQNWNYKLVDPQVRIANFVSYTVCRELSIPR